MHSSYFYPFFINLIRIVVFKIRIGKIWGLIKECFSNCKHPFPLSTNYSSNSLIMTFYIFLILLKKIIFIDINKIKIIKIVSVVILEWN